MNEIDRITEGVEGYIEHIENPIRSDGSDIGPRDAQRSAVVQVRLFLGSLDSDERSRVAELLNRQLMARTTVCLLPGIVGKELEHRGNEIERLKATIEKMRASVESLAKERNSQ